MANRTKPLLIGNWKMHLTTSGAIKLVTEIKNLIKGNPPLDIVIAPPFTALSTIEIALQGSPILLCGQNVHFEKQGAFTGEISVPMLKDVGCSYVLLGHSERRHIFHEENQTLAKKVRTVIDGECIPILCVGETLEERKAKKAFETVEEQLKKGLSRIAPSEIIQLGLAYEPVWAIGTGETASPAQAQEMHHFIRNFISKLSDKPTANEIRILYGGSVKPNNAATLFDQKDVDGLLVGGASLEAKDFCEIINQIT